MPEHEVSERTVSTMSVIRHRSLWLAGSLAVGVALAVGVVASARGEAAAGQQPGTAASSMSALRQAQSASALVPTSARGFVNARRPASVPDSLFEGVWQQGAGRRLIVGAGASGASVYAVPTDRGHVCSVVFIPPSAAAGGCVDRFSAAVPVGWTVFDSDEVDSGSAVIVAGVAPDDVSRVQVVVDGVSAEAKIANNAFVYELSKNNSYPSEIVVTYADGTSRTIAIRDPRAVMRACASGTC